MIRTVLTAALPLIAASCIQSGNYRWDLGVLSPPLVEAERAEAYRGVHSGRFGVRCTAGERAVAFIETWDPLIPAGPARAATMRYRFAETEHIAQGTLTQRSFTFSPAATDALAAQLEDTDDLEVLAPRDAGGVFPIAFDGSDFARAVEWVEAECRDFENPPGSE